MEIQDDNRLYNFSPGVSYIPSLVNFGVCSDSEKYFTFTFIKEKKSYHKITRFFIVEQRGVKSPTASWSGSFWWSKTQHYFHWDMIR